MRDPYQVLGLAKSATDADVKKAFRRLAKIHHPDKNKDDPKAQDKFAELNAAYEILGDAEKRKRFDRGEIDAEGKPRYQGFEGFSAGSQPNMGPEGFSFGFGGSGPFQRRGGAGVDPSDLFSDLFGFGAGQKSRTRPGAGASAPAGGDIRVETSIALADAVKGTTRRMSFPGGRALDVSIPAGVTDGQSIRLRGQGQPSTWGGPPGDAFVTVRVLPDPRFAVEGKDLRLRQPVTLDQAVLGGKVRAPTLTGAVELTIPPNTSTGKTFRLRGKGLPSKEGDGDLLVTVDVVLPPKPDAELEALMRRWRESGRGSEG
jgi:DnaJ-class molecular chaperone